MYLLVAVFNQYDLKDVLDDLFKSSIEGVTVSHIIGKGSYGMREGDDILADFSEKVKIEIVVSTDENLEIAKECIRANCQDLGRGAGKMWWLPVLGVERIRTGEKDIDALTTQKDKKIPNRNISIVTYGDDTPCS